MKKYAFISAIIILASCSRKCETPADFSFFLNEKCMLVNTCQDNSIEGKYLKVISVEKNNCLITNIPDNFFINNTNAANWVIGWGNNIPLYDASCENIRAIRSVDLKTKQIETGELLRGKGFPMKGQRIVFWNRNPSGFIKQTKFPVINPHKWKGFCGESLSFSSVVYDSLLKKWVMLFSECDTDRIQIYIAQSDNLISWSPANNGEPILKAVDFKNTQWGGAGKNGILTQTPFLSDIIRFQSKWYLFMDGYDKTGKRNIGVAVSKNSILGPYEIISEPVITPGKKGSWNDKSCFFGKVVFYKNRFIMFYDGKDIKGNECIGMAYSTDLINWTNYENNPVLDQHYGWRSNTGCAEPSYIECRGDSIFLIAAGAKKFKMGPFHHYITRRMYMDVSGNVDDAQLGVFLSTDGGKSFKPHPDNPVFVNDYSDPYENEHMGGNFELIKTDTMDFIFYQAKSSFGGSKYNIHVRTKK